MTVENYLYKFHDKEVYFEVGKLIDLPSEFPKSKIYRYIDSRDVKKLNGLTKIKIISIDLSDDSIEVQNKSIDLWLSMEDFL